MKTALLFAGQGAQRVGMAQDICGCYPGAAAIFEKAQAALSRSIADIAWRADEQTLNLTENTQPAMFTAELAMYEAIRESVRPAFFAGFSLGEWAALTAAGALPFDEALKLVQLRALAMQEAVPVGMGGMAVIMGREAEFVTALCARAGDVSPSNYNCPGQVSVAGTAQGIETLLAIAGAEGIAAQRLAVSIPSHCALMRPAADKLARSLAEVSFAAPAHPVVMNVTARAETEPARIRENLISQLTCPVRFEESLKMMFGVGVDTFIEVGPGKTLSGFVKRTAKQLGKSPNVLRTDDLETLQATLAALEDK